MASVVIRTDASHTIGGGHVMRCLSLAQSLRNAGANVEFISRVTSGDMLDIVRSSGFSVHALPAGSGPGPKIGLRHDSWLGTSWRDDADVTLKAMQERVDWLVVDHYAIDAMWESAVRGACTRLLAIDDLADRAHDCDLLLDQNLYADMLQRYRNLVPTRCRTLLGPEFALLRDEFREARQTARRRDGRIRRILVSFGSGDAHGTTMTALRAVARQCPESIHVDVVVGSLSRYVDAVKNLCVAHANWTLHEGTSRVASLMSAADLGIGGGGVMTWERCGLGLPALIIAQADNQAPIAEAVHAAGAAVYLGSHESVHEDDIAQALSRLVTDPERMKTMSRAAAELVDCEGSFRVASAMIGARSE